MNFSREVQWPKLGLFLVFVQTVNGSSLLLFGGAQLGNNKQNKFQQIQSENLVVIRSLVP